MCHVAQALDRKTCKQRYDERIRPIWRTRGHDIEEFRAVVARHGTYKRDLERFAEALLKRKNDLFEQAESSAQIELPAAVLQAADRLTESVRSGEVTQMTIGGAGRKVVIDQAGAQRIHDRAKAAAKKKPRDPG